MGWRVGAEGVEDTAMTVLLGIEEATVETMDIEV